jgi:hypothetical protein
MNTPFAQGGNCDAGPRGDGARGDGAREDGARAEAYARLLRQPVKDGGLQRIEQKVLPFFSKNMKW